MHACAYKERGKRGKRGKCGKHGKRGCVYNFQAWQNCLL